MFLEGGSDRLIPNSAIHVFGFGNHLLRIISTPDEVVLGLGEVTPYYKMYRVSARSVGDYWNRALVMNLQGWAGGIGRHREGS